MYTMSVKRITRDRNRRKYSTETILKVYQLRLDHKKWFEIESITGLSRQRWHKLFQREGLV